ncbi:MotA/TolQ/ExbB proton channel family protein [Ectothiorhodospira lacustris]|uniref:MotA/TolQ/ExbB proton channel family protein n=1 Tax=Ectothiorhodospira lacustris TaxID=2899127 RepID=UPI001EE91716|nr:MotA/TolQ/ExbB proton channel family protein [Ectothiorhodospira lacustris]MCG5510037.1 MotA/TolQ/ExbB proton channel family protein [Ectothiorhodospira lacustris]MCG5521783.1 MotA/TolQ/ExbB proton channel family protein [Ectothiorhodospira lacustris]
MFELVKAGGWLMLPIIACSVIALSIVIERFWTLRRRRVIPSQLVVQIWQWIQAGELDDARIRTLREGSPLGRILATGLVNRRSSREVMKETIEETGRRVAHELERFLNTLGTIAAITPLLGLLGTVVGMIQVFSVITAVGVGSPGELAAGISQALITTAAGISVAIPAMIFHRYFRGRVDELVLDMEQEAIKLVEVLKGERVAAPGVKPS